MGQRLYVGNLPFSASEDEIRELFGQNGRTVTDVRAGPGVDACGFVERRIDTTTISS